MNAYPIGNDLTVKWSLLYSDGSVFPLSNYDYELSYRTNRGNKVVTDTSVISVDENILTWTFKGDEQAVSGRYTICLKITFSGSKVVELQYDNAFMLSPLSGFKGAGSEIVLQSYCDAIDLKDAVLQARKAMDLAADAVINTANSAADAKAAKEAAEVTAAQAKVDAESAKTMAADAKDKVAVAEKAATDASRDAAAAQQAARTASDHITSLEQAIAELPDGQAVSEKVAEHTTKLSELGQEMYPKVLAEYNGYINPDTGVPVSNTYWRYSDLFIVYPGLKITIYNRIDPNQIILAYYDAGKNYLKDISPKDSEAILSEYKERKVVVPDGVSFARFHSGYNVDTVAFALPYDGKNKDAMAAIQVSEYLVRQVNEKLNETNEKVASIDERITIIPKQNGYINTDTGDIVSSTYWRYSDLFPVTPGTTLKIHSRTNTGLVLLAFYDQYGGYLKDISPRSSSSGSSYEDNNIVVPAVATFARFHSAYNMDAVATCVIDGVSIPENSVPSIQPKDWYNYKTVLPVPFEWFWVIPHTQG